MTDEKKLDDRGLRGQEIAKSVPFRRGGRPCDYSTSLGRANRLPGASYKHAMALASALGLIPSRRFA